MWVRANRRVQVGFGYEPRTFDRDGRRRKDRIWILGVPIRQQLPTPFPHDKRRLCKRPVISDATDHSEAVPFP